MSSFSEDCGSFLIKDQQFRAPKLEGALYIVATPIGNLGDITLRALETLAGCDVLACEDTRVTGILLQRYGIRSKMMVYHEHNGEKQRPLILEALAQGKSVALVSDAGTPLISDPGYKLVAEVRGAGHKIVPIPGASAMLAGLVGAGLPSDTLTFAGFLPNKSTARCKRLQELALTRATLIFYESPHRLQASLQDMVQCFGAEHKAVVARELTKRFEEFAHGTLAELVTHFSGDRVKGEIAILIAPGEAHEPDATQAEDMLKAALKEMPVSAAAKQVSKATGVDRKTLYARALELKDAGSEAG
ncbi:16S rRNA (cytidine(1402)-2'-O)-methyltransferase [Polycladidibacter hongkongensis]|uniref:16S rRNA (cytidine(1402)-2'-O)-methyltransferase n=1 Tax=Polycladidibacter hongkongensis TaxID=1647556 RepID=UPI000833C9B4|nr:16S rRNA (cytidine(1402)-2'-O)-methyltransferase [Pseudovibrio hongkongensis]